MYTVDRLRNAKRKRFIKDNLPVRYFDKTLNDFTLEGPEEVVKANGHSLSLVNDYLMHAKSNLCNGLGLFFYGPVGVGKTMMMTIIAKAVIELFDSENFKINEEIGNNSTKNRMYRITAPDIVEFTFPSGLSDERKLIREGIRDVSGLWIDDISKLTQTKTANEIAYLDGLLRHRYDFGLPTFYTSQVPLKSKGNIDGINKVLSEPIYELIRDTSIPVLFTGPSRRGL